MSLSAHWCRYTSVHPGGCGSGACFPQAENEDSTRNASVDETSPERQRPRRTLTYCPRFELANDVDGRKRQAHIAKIRALVGDDEPTAATATTASCTLAKYFQPRERTAKIFLTRSTEEFRECAVARARWAMKKDLGVAASGSRGSSFAGGIEHKVRIVEFGSSYGKTTRMVLDALLETTQTTEKKSRSSTAVRFTACDVARSAVTATLQEIAEAQQNVPEERGSLFEVNATLLTKNFLFSADSEDSRSSAGAEWSQAVDREKTLAELLFPADFFPCKNGETDVELGECSLFVSSPHSGKGKAPDAAIHTLLLFLDIGGDRNALSVLEAVARLLRNECCGPRIASFEIVVKSEFLARIEEEQRPAFPEGGCDEFCDWMPVFLDLIETVPVLTLSYIFTSFEHTALLGELLFLVGAYTIWNSVSNAWWASYFKSKHYWPNLADRKGFICSSHQAELVLGSTLAPHHLFAGALHIYGHYFFPPSSAPQLLFIRHGILWEAAFNLHDYVSLFFRLFPHNDPAHRSHVLPLVAHHFGALAFGSFVILRADVLGREDLQRICIALEAAAGMNLGLLAYGYTCCFKRDVVPLWLSSILSASLFMYYRFYEFPVNAYSLVRFLLENTESVLVLEGASGAGEGSFHPVFTSGAVLSVLGFTIFNFHTVWMSTRRSLKMTEILLTEKFADRAWGQAALKLTRTMKKILFGGAKNADKKQQ
eukprot:g5311.t1